MPGGGGENDVATILDFAPVRPERPAARVAPPSATARFLEFNFGTADFPAVLGALAARPADAPFAYVVTPNVDHVVRLERMRSDLWPAYRRAWITLCDSRILGKLATSAGIDLPIIPGSDLTAALFENTVRPSNRIAILGGEPAMIDRLRTRFGLKDIVHYNPPMGFINNAAERARAIQFLIDARARFSFLAVGSPQQEILAYRVARTGAATGIGLCVGASLQFLTNEKSRAPQVIQSLALEWLYRLAAEPRRMWRRYLVDGPHIFAIFQHWRRST